MKKIQAIFAAFFMLTITRIFADSDPWNENQKLRQKLLKNYDALTLPNKDTNGTTTVNIKLFVHGFWVNDDEQIFATNGWLIMSWLDNRLKWDLHDYGGIQSGHFGDEELWKPVIHVYNNAKVSETDQFKNVHLLAYSNGRVIWAPPFHYEVKCPIDLLRWPLDSQSCMIRIGSWTATGWQINFESPFDTKDVDVSPSTYNNWVILKTYQQRNIYEVEGSDEPSIDIEFTFLLKRNSPAFAAAVVVPAVVIPLLMMSQFVLPVGHPERLKIVSCCAILDLMEILFLKKTLPKLGTSVPLIVRYYCEGFIMVAITATISAFLSRLAHQQNLLTAFPSSKQLKWLPTAIPAATLSIRNQINKQIWRIISMRDERVETPDESDATSEDAVEWSFAAKLLDRLSIVLVVLHYFYSIFRWIWPILHT